MDPTTYLIKRAAVMVVLNLLEQGMKPDGDLLENSLRVYAERADRCPGKLGSEAHLVVQVLNADPSAFNERTLDEVRDLVKHTRDQVFATDRALVNGMGARFGLLTEWDPQ